MLRPVGARPPLVKVGADALRSGGLASDSGGCCQSPAASAGDGQQPLCVLRFSRHKAMKNRAQPEGARQRRARWPLNLPSTWERLAARRAGPQVSPTCLYSGHALAFSPTHRRGAVGFDGPPAIQAPPRGKCKRLRVCWPACAGQQTHPSRPPQGTRGSVNPMLNPIGPGGSLRRRTARPLVSKGVVV